MNIKITGSVPEDARGIATVLYKSWLSTYPNQELGITEEDVAYMCKDRFSENAIKKLEGDLRDIPATQKRIVAKFGNEVVGMATMIKDEDRNQLKAIYIVSEYQGKGIGMMLWNDLLKFIDPLKDTIVQVAEYNQHAIKFYEKLGFVDTAKRWVDEKFKTQSGIYIPLMEMILRK